MKSFRTEIENPLVEKDIIDLEKKIGEFKSGSISDQKFRSLRLARGIYGQRQPGVQMIRIKLPYGRVTPKQLIAISNISDEYSTGILHLTTRQDVQIHYVSLDRTPELWARLEEDDITIREACGNTVRNVTASDKAGIDPNEPFDVTPYAHAVFSYFLRKPFGQELGRKIKIAFSNSEEDTAFSYIHDIGFIPKVKMENEVEERGFKVLLGGGLGAQPFLAQTAFEFLTENKVIPFIEAALRVFDRHGERISRHKARLKFLINKIGLAEFLNLVDEESKAVIHKEYTINRNIPLTTVPERKTYSTFRPLDEASYRIWLATNTFHQKQAGFLGVYVKVLLGNISTAKARQLADVISLYAADDVRITINQGFLLRFVREAALLPLYIELLKLQLAEPGFNSIADITACPGTDTCNLGISNSTQVAKELERVIVEEYPQLIHNNDIKIKISGCMNSCGQHSLAQIGFHGSSFKVGAHVVPALQVLLGGGTVGNGIGRISDKVIKVSSKRAPEVLRTLLDDYKLNAENGEKFNTYYERNGENYFYQLLKTLGNNSDLMDEEYIDWGGIEKFKTAIGVGECASVIIDLVATLIYEAEEKLEWSAEAFDAGSWNDSIYHSYSALISAAKALLLDKEVHVNTQHGIINDFDKYFIETGDVILENSFREFALQINQREPSKEFAEEYFDSAKAFFVRAKEYRQQKVKLLTI